MYYVKGKLAECGSKIRKGWIAPTTATAVVRLEAAGAFRLGALNMVEFAFGPTGVLQRSVMIAANTSAPFDTTAVSVSNSLVIRDGRTRPR